MDVIAYVRQQFFLIRLWASAQRFKSRSIFHHHITLCQACYERVCFICQYGLANIPDISIVLFVIVFNRLIYYSFFLQTIVVTAFMSEMYFRYRL